MIKCFDGKCPNDKGDLCCHSCEIKLECKDSCACDNPSNCGSAAANEKEVVLFRTNSLPTLKTLAAVCAAKKNLEEQEKDLKKQLLASMEKHRVKSFNNDVVKLTYVAATTATSVDSAKLKEKYPLVAIECSKTSNKSAYVKVEVK